VPPMTFVDIHYHRPPDRRTVFHQRLVHRTPDVLVTLMEETPLDRPVRVGGATVLEAGASVVWFTFPGAWHDIGRFHTRDGRFTGWYANVLTPVRFLDDTTWETTDLFLDVFLEPAGAVHLLDADELAEAEARGDVTAAQAAAAREEADRLVGLARSDAWPPPVVDRWPLERARAAADG